MNLPVTGFQRYEAGSTPLHRLDARVKVVAALLLIVGVLLTPERRWIAYPLMWTLIGSLAAVAQVSAWRLSRLAGLALPFTLAASTLLFTTPGNPLVIGITDAGLARFAAIVLKSWLSMQAALLFAMSTAFTDVLWALEQLGLPKPLVAIVGYMYRYLFTLREEAERLMRARAARSGSVVSHNSPGGRLLWQAQVAGGMVGSLFLRSYERSDRVYNAMLARGYTGHMQTMNPHVLRRIDYIVTTMAILFLLLLQLAGRV